jgi:SIR2-like protein
VHPAHSIDDSLGPHCRIVLRRLREGKVIPFLGAGTNLCGRPSDVNWLNDEYLPSGQELAQYLADGYGYPPNEPPDLLRVSQYVQATTGAPALYDELHELFDRDYAPTALHHLLAALPSAIRKWRGEQARYQLIITTNYDDLLETAFRAVGEPFDLVTYLAKGPDRGKFLHSTQDGDARLIDRPNCYRELSLDRRTVILKIHGAVNREDAERDSFVITEDHYIEYLAQTDIANVLPAALMAVMNESHFLFLGYSLRDWNLRVILHRIWGAKPFEEKFMSWAVQKQPSVLDDRLWRSRNVDILDVDLGTYADALRHAAFDNGSAGS